MSDTIFHEIPFYPGCNFHVYVYPKNRIEVHTRNGGGEVIDVKVFRVGDVAEYDSFNLKYTGVIKAITGKNVIIQPPYERKTRRLDFRNFSVRNYDFDVDRVAKENWETSMYI